MNAHTKSSRSNPEYLRPLGRYSSWSSVPARLLRALEVRSHPRWIIVLVLVVLGGLLGGLIGGVVFDEPLGGLIIGLDLSGIVSAIVYILLNY